MAINFEIGNVVKLKGGTSIGTVASIDHTTGDVAVAFDLGPGNVTYQTFDGRMLERCNPNADDKLTIRVIGEDGTRTDD